MSHQTISSELLTELSTEQQEVIAGGHGWDGQGYGYGWYGHHRHHGYYGHGWHGHYGPGHHNWW